MAVGDDVVDLGDPAIATSHLRPRFVARVLTPAERRRFEGAVDPKSLLWAHFALKEAAYKAVAQLRAPPGFAYQRLEVTLETPLTPSVGPKVRRRGASGESVPPLLNAQVRFEDLVLRARVRIGERFVHAIAWLGEEPDLAEVQEGSWDDSSAAVREALCRAAAPRLGDHAEPLRIARDRVPGSWDGFGPPRLERRGQALPGAVSLSHDGRFISFAARLGR